MNNIKTTEELKALSEQTQKKITQSVTNWCDFLKTAGKFYKAYEFEDQILIYAQKPDAIACGELPVWSKLQRQINTNATQIDLLPKDETSTIRSIYDLADTKPSHEAVIETKIWTLDPSDHNTIKTHILSHFDVKSEYIDQAGRMQAIKYDDISDLGNIIGIAMQHIVERTYADDVYPLEHSARKHSQLSELNDVRINLLFKELVNNSVTYTVLSRCGFNPEDYVDPDSLQNIVLFDTPETLLILGKTITTRSREMLMEVEKNVNPKQLEKRETKEYNEKNALKRESEGDKDEQKKQGTEFKPVWTGQRKIPERISEETLYGIQTGWGLGRTPEGDRPGSDGDVSPSDREVQRNRGGNRRTESNRPRQMGGDHEQHQADGEGNREQRHRVQLEKDQSAEQEPADFFSVDKTITNEKQITLFDLPRVSDVPDVKGIGEIPPQIENEAIEIKTPFSDFHLSDFKVGDAVYLEGTLFHITGIQSGSVELLDPTLAYPIFRSERIETFERLLRQDERNETVTHGRTLTSERESATQEKQKEQIQEIISDQTMAQMEQLFVTSKQIGETPEIIAQNFHINDFDLGVGGQKVKYQNNVAAIRLLKDIETQNRSATPQDQEILSKYVGWGGLPSAFDENNEKWNAEYIELKNLLTPEEYASARSSTLNAHYTSPIIIKNMYTTIEQMGLQPKTILEPAMGIGNFFGMLPASMSHAALFGVEMDSITGRIANKLYPKANVAIKGFETVDLPDHSLDLAIGNVPFGSYKLHDPRYNNQNLLIHDYFFVKTLDKIRPGGIIAFISSKGTLDKQDKTVRNHIALRADLLGAIRLPNNAFLKNAGTEVTSDIIFLQKRAEPPEVMPDWITIGCTTTGIPVNQYFAQNPNMILGEMKWDNSMYGNETKTTCVPFLNENLAEQMADAIKQIKRPDFDLWEKANGISTEAIQARLQHTNLSRQNYSYIEKQGSLYFMEDNRPILVDQPQTTRIKGMIRLREITRNLIDLQMQNGTEEQIKAAQTELNAVYDQFVAEFGFINNKGNRNAFQKDSSYYLLCSLEVQDENDMVIGKADMFTKRTINPKMTVTSVNTASEALAVSINEKACVDLPFMSSLMDNQSIDNITANLKGVIYKNPEAESNPEIGWETADEYLSGNVRKKLEIAQAAAENNANFAENVTALQQAQPKELTAAEIDVRLGATWIKPKYYTKFVHELFKTPVYMQDKIQVQYSNLTGKWNVSCKTLDGINNSLAYVTYGTKRCSGYALVENTLNLQEIKIQDIVEEDGREVTKINMKETILAQQKQEQIKEEFKSWVWKDPTRRAELCQTYNHMFNSIRPREYNGGHIQFVGMNPQIKLKPHQENAVARVLYGGNTLLAHCVGAGKTYTIASAIIESKRLGLAKKSLVVVPNHLTEQWGTSFLQLYPGAQILVATKKDFEPANRKKFCARIATGNYDAIIIGHSQFEKIPLSQERQKISIQGQINQIMTGMQETKDRDHYTIKQMEKTKKSLEVRMKKLNDQSRKDDVITFEQLGIDRLYVDEAHSFKNLFLDTKMRNVAGISQTEAQKSSDMFMKCKYMDEITGNKGVIFATGTPISNSMTELYTMMRYLQSDLLKESGLEHFDSWAANFGATVTALEITPEGGGFRNKTRFSKFFNLPELMAMWKEAADIQTSDMLSLPIPEPEYITEITKPSLIQKEMMEEMGLRAEAVRNRQISPKEDNMLKITSDGRKLALDQRLADPTTEDEPESKINSCVQNIVRVFHDTKNTNGTQLIFCDLSTPKKDGSFNVYQDMKQKLTEKGIPEREIAFIHDANTEKQKDTLFSKVRKGQIRILIGSTAKMGAGTNVQDHLTALHHLDCPWRPADIEQREGRALRQGNQSSTVKIFKYITENTFDAYNWGILENKQKFIGQLMSSKNPSRSCEDVDETALSYAEVKALASGDPRIIQMTELENEVTKLKLVKSNYESQQYYLEDQLLHTFPGKIKGKEELIMEMKKDADLLHSKPSHNFDMKVMGKNYTERKAAGTAIIQAIQKSAASTPIKIGEYKDFSLVLQADIAAKKFKIDMKNNLTYTVELGDDPVGNVVRLEHMLKSIPEKLKETQVQLENLCSQKKEAEIQINNTFPQEKELVEKTNTLNQLKMELNIQKDPTKRPEEKTNKSKILKNMIERLSSPKVLEPIRG